jgi:hypothetical protein
MMSDLSVRKDQLRRLRLGETEESPSPLPPEVLIASVWSLTEEIYSLAGHDHAQSRLQRDVVAVTRGKR